MAKRRTKEQIDADKIIKKQLNILGEKIYEEARETSRFDTGQLQNSINYMVKPDTKLTMAQVYYGKYNYPKGINSGDKNALLIAVKENAIATTKIIVKEINDQLNEQFTNRKQNTSK